MPATLLTPAPYLRQGLLSNATTNAGFALFMVLAGELAPDRLAIPAPLLIVEGAVLGLAAAGLARLALRPEVRLAAIWSAIVFNAVWALGCVLLVDAGLIAPSRAGSVFLLAQGGVAAMYAVLQWIGLQRSRAPAAAG
jgi:hypothetical protein